jgi:flagellar motor switch/type III secretory pathway protein FliN
MASNAVLKMEEKPAEPTPVAAPPPSVQVEDLLDTMPWLPCNISLELPVVRFTIGDLLNLAKGSVVATACHQTSDVPVRVNGLLIGWTEFEVIEDRLAVRITEQA